LLQKLVYGTTHWDLNGQYTVTGDPWFETRSAICSAGKWVNLHLDELRIIRVKKDAGLYRDYWRTGSR